MLLFPFLLEKTMALFSFFLIFVNLWCLFICVDGTKREYIAGCTYAKNIGILGIVFNTVAVIMNAMVVIPAII